jgi:hypothetical protein
VVQVVLDLIMVGVEAQGVSELEQEYLLLREPHTPLLLAQVAMVAHTIQEQVVQEAVRLLLVVAHHRLRHPALFLLVAVAAIEAN